MADRKIRLNRRVVTSFDGLPTSLKEAKDVGSIHYFTGRACKRGHIDARHTINGMCMECSRLKSANYVCDNPGKISERNRNYYQSNKDRENQRSKKWSKENREKCNAAKKVWRELNKDHFSEIRRVWYQANIEKCRQWGRDYAASHREEARERASKWKQENPDKIRVMVNNRRAMKAAATGSHTDQDIARIMRLQKGKCAICGAPIKSSWTIDHITALSKGGSNAARNIQLVCRSCNASKHARDQIEFMRSMGRLL